MRISLILSVLILVACSTKQKHDIDVPNSNTKLSLEKPERVPLSYKHKPLSNKNLLSALSDESKVKDSHFWYYNDGTYAHHDPSVKTLYTATESYQDNDGSFLLINAKDNYSEDEAFDRLLIKESFYSVPVNPSTVYTFSFMMKVKSVCPSPGVLINIRTNESGIFKTLKTASVFANKMNEWEEVSVVFKTPKTNAQLSFQITNYRSHNNQICTACNCDSENHDCWPIYIDDFSLTEGVGFSEQPKAKKEYQKDPIRRIDDYGNIELKIKGKWKPFFPLMIYSQNTRLNPGLPNDREVYQSQTPGDPSDDGFRLYKKMGFNTVAWVTPKFSLPKTIEAGLYGNIDLTFYGYSRSVEALKEDILFLQKSDLEKHILFYYHDNEDNFNIDYIDWRSYFENVKKISNVPIYQLNGNPGNLSQFNNQRCELANITGSYLQNNNYSFQVADHSNIVNSPNSIAQINLPLDKHIRPYIYFALGSGAKGIGFFRDEPYMKVGEVLRYNPSKDIVNAVWFKDFNAIALEIEAMMNVIRQAHWTNWDVELVKPVGEVKIASRMFNGEAFVFISNFSNKKTVPELNFSNINLNGYQVTDFHTGKNLSTVKQDRFSVPLEINDGRLLRFSKNK